MVGPGLPDLSFEIKPISIVGIFWQFPFSSVGRFFEIADQGFLALCDFEIEFSDPGDGLVDMSQPIICHGLADTPLDLFDLLLV